MGFSLSGALKGGITGFMAGGPLGALAGGAAGGFLGGKADDAREDALNNANRAGQAGYAQSRQELMDSRQRMEGYTQPYRQFGEGGFDPYQKAMRRYEDLLQGKFDYKQSPGYQFRLREGLKSIGIADGEPNQRNLSGSQLKGIQGYAQNFASLDYNNQYSQFANEQNRQLGLLESYRGGAQNQINTGMQANLALGNYDQNVAQQLGQQSIASGRLEGSTQGLLGQQKANKYQGILNGLTSLSSMFAGGGGSPGGIGAGGEGGMMADLAGVF